MYKISTGVIFTIIGSCLVLLVFSLITSKPSEYPVLIRIVLGLGAGVFSLALFFKPAVRFKIAIISLSTGFSLIGAEAVLDFMAVKTNFDDRFQKAAKKQNAPWDSRTIFDVVEDLRGQGIEAHLPQGARKFNVGIANNLNEDIYSLGEISNTTIVLCNELGYWSIYQSDEHGFNNPIGIWDSHQISLVSIGDSFVHGECVSPEKTISATIRRVHYASLNLGIAGTGPLVQLAVLKEYVSSLTPDSILWFFYEGNDLVELTSSYYETKPEMKRYIDSNFTQNLLERQVEIDSLKKNVSDSALLSHIQGISKNQNVRTAMTWPLLRNVRGRIGTVISATKISDPSNPGGRLEVNRLGERCPTESMLNNFRLIYRDAQEYVQEWGGRIYFIYLPSWFRYADPSALCRDSGGDIFLHDKVIDTARSIGLHVIDTTDVFNQQVDPLALFPFRECCHYTEEGYDLVGNHVLQFIEID